MRGEEKAKFIGVARHRLGVDGDGVTTLAAFHGCTLRCKYCLNPQSIGRGEGCEEMTVGELYERVKVDELYFLATGGGVCFGGGEPCLQVGFIRRFREICGGEWKLTIETALNVPMENVRSLIGVVDCWIVDVKDMDSEVYRTYTGKDNTKVVDNLRVLREAGASVVVRLPLIKGYNTLEGREQSKSKLERMGFDKFNLFEYIAPTSLRNNVQQ